MLIQKSGLKVLVFYFLIMTAIISYGKKASHTKYELCTGKEFRHAFVNPKDNPKLPNVLLIGDSISIGYTVGVRKLLKGKADVYRIPTNGRHTAFGINNINKWLGKKKWDVILFNFGIWDNHYLRNGKMVTINEPNSEELKEMKLRYTTKQYIENLKQILSVLKDSKAKLIWASTTPVTVWDNNRKAYLLKKNKEAAVLMKKEEVLINNLYTFVFPHLKTWQSKDGCHFTSLGYKKLAEKVASSISDALNKKTLVSRKF